MRIGMSVGVGPFRVYGSRSRRNSTPAAVKAKAFAFASFAALAFLCPVAAIVVFAIAAVALVITIAVKAKERAAAKEDAANLAEYEAHRAYRARQAAMR